MKILRMRLLNLNSLRGTTIIDFTKPPFTNSGLFAITGPTGAGKTTILDAITLALYGRVARYVGEKSPESVMSKHTGECSAEVEFACASGTYRSVWQLQRAHKRYSGAMQNPKRRVIEVATETILTEKIEDSEQKIQELTGLNYDRFLRSVMLAQGEFALFLKSKSAERTELLQQVTGAAIYGDISRAAYERCDVADRAYELLRAESAAVPVLDAEARTAHVANSEGTTQRLKAVGEEYQTLLGRIDNARRWGEYQNAVLQLGSDKVLHEQKVLSSAPEMERFRHHERAQPFAVDLATCGQLQREVQQDTARQHQLEAALPALEIQLTAAELEQQKALDTLSAKERSMETATVLWNTVTELDGNLASARKSCQLLTEQLDANTKRLTASIREQTKALDEHATMAANLAKCETWLKDHANEVTLTALYPEMHASVHRWQEAEKLKQERTRERDALALLIQNQRVRLEAAGASLLSLEKDALAQQEAIHVAERSLAAVSAQRSLPELEQQRDAAHAQLTELEKLHAGAIRLQGIAANLHQKSIEQETLTGELTQLTGEQARLAQQLEDAAKLIEAHTRTHLLAVRVQSLEAHRRNLQNGEPCPLCGAKEHPFSSADALPSDDAGEAERALKQAQMAQAKVAKALKKADADLSTKKEAQRRVTADRLQLENEYGASLRLWSGLAAPFMLADQHANTSLLEARVSAAKREWDRTSQQVAQTRDAIQKLQLCKDTAKDTRSAVDKLRASLDKDQALMNQQAERLPTLEQGIVQAAAICTTEQTALSAMVLSFIEAPFDAASASVGIANLRGRGELFIKQQNAAQDLRTRLQAQGERLKAIEGSVATEQATEAESRSKANTAIEDCKRMEKERTALFGTRSVDKERQSATTAIQQARQTLETARQATEHKRSQQALTAQELASLKVAIKRRTDELNTKQQQILMAVQAAGFATLDLVQGALLSPDEAQRLASVREQLHAVEASLKSRQSALLTAKETLPTDAEMDAQQQAELLASKEKLETERSALERTLGELDGILKADNENRQRLATFGERIANAHREYLRWNRLNALIGSAGGTVFARFAQGLTLERLTILANTHLANLNPRYTLHRVTEDGADDLELEIADIYQGNVTRPMCSLSGGETFLISLSLALGLSELARGHSAIESLFIDEGFSTLDSDTLEAAMAALENLQAQGKSIGVISHMMAMQERITAQIRVIKESGGCSLVEIC
ncbi:MAG: AAA family ATPase [Verrucomicrobiota bacterium]|nr:AAA family ATPase [Verrucomicrobiota bacterium]